MKITVSINLGGYSFNIDEDAYAELKRYLKNLELHFAGEESSSEILSDIETRMAEIFRTKLTGYKQVINIQDVSEAISVMGTPEDIADNEGPSAREKFSISGIPQDVPRYRPSDYWWRLLRYGSILGSGTLDPKGNIYSTCLYEEESVFLST